MIVNAPNRMLTAEVIINARREAIAILILLLAETEAGSVATVTSFVRIPQRKPRQDSGLNRWIDGRDAGAECRVKNIDRLQGAGVAARIGEIAGRRAGQEGCGQLV